MKVEEEESNDMVIVHCEHVKEDLNSSGNDGHEQTSGNGNTGNIENIGNIQKNPVSSKIGENGTGKGNEKSGGKSGKKRKRKPKRMEQTSVSGGKNPVSEAQSSNIDSTTNLAISTDDEISFPPLARTFNDVIGSHNKKQRKRANRKSPKARNDVISSHHKKQRKRTNRKFPKVSLDRRLADRVYNLANQGIQVQFDQFEEEIAIGGSKSNSKGSKTANSSKISIQSDEDNLERCRQYLLEKLQLKSLKKKTKKRKQIGNITS